MITYSQNNEDVVLERLFHEVKTGFYVDVGAWDPVRHSVTKHFYDRGWCGINVEPVHSLWQSLVEARPRDVNVQAAIGPTGSRATFFECEEESYLSTMDVQVAADMRKRGLTVLEYEIEILSLTQLLERHAPPVIEFLKIDVEGYEKEVLESLDLTRFRPRALVVESTVPDSGLPDWDDPDAKGSWKDWEPGVLQAGYELALFDGLNRFYLRPEDQHLGKRLKIPVGIFDVSERPIEREMRTEIARLRVELADRKSDLMTVTKELGQSWAGGEELTRIVKMVSEDQAAKEVVIQNLIAEIETLKHEARLRDEQVAQLQVALALARS